MAAVWINTGTISISEGGTTVTGSGTSFLTGGTQKGDMFQAPDGREYEITNIVSDTQLSIFKAYQGTTVSGSTNWDIIPTQGYVKALVDEVREYVETNNTIVDEISTTGLSIAHGGTGATTASEARTNLGLGNIDNTSDANKPISTATQMALDSKANASHTHDDRYYTETEVDSLLAGKSNTGHTHDDRYYTETEITSLLSGKADASALSAHTSNTTNPHSVTKTQVGLSNVDNTSDLDKPISTATQTALNGKAPLASPDLTGTPTAPTAPVATNNTQIATTAFVQSKIAADRPFESTASNIKMDGTASAGSLNTVPRGDHVHPTDTSRAPVASPSFTGTPTAPTQSSSDNSTLIATTAWVRNSMATIATALGFVFVTGSTGYIKFPSYLGGFMLQWGYGVPNASGNLVGTLPVAFPNSHLVGFCSTVSETTPHCAVTTLSLTPTSYEFRVRTSSQAAIQQPLFWFAIGR